MMLSFADDLALPHGLDVPEERLLAEFAPVALFPLRTLESLGLHVPHDYKAVVRGAHELTAQWQVDYRLDSVAVAL